MAVTENVMTTLNVWQRLSKMFDKNPKGFLVGMVVICASVTTFIINKVYAARIDDRNRTIEEQKSVIQAKDFIIEKCEEKVEEKTERIIHYLEHGTTKLEKVESKADTLLEKAKQTDTKFQITKKTLRNAVQ